MSRVDALEAAVDNVAYRAIEIDAISCTGCVADGFTEEQRSLCQALPQCSKATRSDGKNVVWLKAA